MDIYNCAFPSLVPEMQRFSSIVCAILSFFPFVYLVATYESLIYRAIIPENWDMLMAYAEVLLILGVIYRLSGPIMPVCVMVFLIYNLYGDSVPGTFSGPGFGLDMLLGKMYCETEAGIFGTITGVSVKYLIYFTTLGAVITRLEYGKIIANIALLFVGKSPASPGRASAFMAVLMGMFSGSGAADAHQAALRKGRIQQIGGCWHYRHSRFHCLHHAAGAGFDFLSDGGTAFHSLFINYSHGCGAHAAVSFRHRHLQ